ncbi:prephenate dehydrogenase [Dendrosporobacter sp. 1207_IL3150]|uniref:prephenate dehydrogenase n=1 Tax=Dendrosporobacter sp. 1207_IL3150 TaxID=3084054 RepID=UPI002FDB4018
MNITIIGLGLIGGSIGLAIKNKYGSQASIIGVDNNAETLKKSVECGAVDESTTDYAKAVSQADIIFLCTPVLQIISVVKEILPFLRKDTIITDVGSTKAYLCENLAKLLPPDVHYVAGHPMAGSEQSGILAADKDLFKDKWYIVIPETSKSVAAVEKIYDLLMCTGANITVMDLEQHDKCAAVISHVPHVTAAALVNLLGLTPSELECNLKLAGGGFRDTTRIASSNADMWADICMTNSEAIVSSLMNLQTIIQNVITAIQQEERQIVHEFFKTAKLHRDALISASLAPNER